ncbi:MAG TPA: DNA polymerase I [Sutterella sp.]|nr:DNA polymerase I [Sutterella sp.]
MPKLLLVDGTNFLYRAYHGLPDLRTSQGEPTGAIKGFYNMLGMLKNLVKPDYAACIFDAKGPTFRNEIYPAYKANRPPMPDDLRAQAGPVRELVALLGWPVLEVPGIETDDVIGTITTIARAKDWSVFIATGDKDMAQLVDESTFIVNTMTRSIMDEAGVIEKFGVRADQMIDFLALMGDAVDNVPGIEKCGPKTAAKWLKEYETLDNLVAHATDVTGKIGENLRAGIPFLETAKDLVTIRREVDTSAWLGEGVEGLVFAAPDETALDAFSSRWQMRTVKREAVRAKEASASALAPEVDLFAETKSQEKKTSALSRAVFWDALGALPVAFVAGADITLDALTDATDGFTTRISVLAIGVGDTVYVTRLGGAMPEAAAKRLSTFLNAAHVRAFEAKKLGHGLLNIGINLPAIDDVALMSYVAEAHLKHDLSALAIRIGRDAPDETDILGKGASAVTADFVGDDEIAKAMLKRAQTIDICADFYRQGTDAAFVRIYDEIEKPLSVVLLEMERAGVNVDVDFLKRQSAEIGAKLTDIEERIYTLAGTRFNIGSPKQLSEILFTRLSLAVPPKTKKTASGGYSTSEEVLSALAEDYPIARALLDWRMLSKLKSTYTDKLPEMVNPTTGRIHTRFSQVTAVTGRLASLEPNLQNIPIRTEEGRLVREAFVAGEGRKIVSADYSQIELRIMAHLSGDEGLISAFKEGRDIHRATAAEVFGVALEAVTATQRRAAKVINFGLIYGMSAYGLSQNLGIEPSEAKRYIERYFERYPKVYAYMQEMRDSARTKGYVQTAFGRRLYLPDIASSKVPVRQGAERQAINAPMQGTAADLIKRAMIATSRFLAERGLQTRLVLQVHDELVLEVPENELEIIVKTVPELMAGVATLSVPLVAQIGSADNWEAAH